MLEVVGYIGQTLTYLKGALVPLIAVITVWIAAEQMRVARAKLQFDLFDRRLSILVSTQTMLIGLLRDGKITDSDFSSFSAGVGMARFLLDPSIADYLRDLRKHAAELYSIQTALSQLERSAKPMAAINKESEHTKWLLDQMDGLGERFEPYLHVQTRRFGGRQ